MRWICMDLWKPAIGVITHNWRSIFQHSQKIFSIRTYTQDCCCCILNVAPDHGNFALLASHPYLVYYDCMYFMSNSVDNFQASKWFQSRLFAKLCGWQYHSIPQMWKYCFILIPDCHSKVFLFLVFYLCFTFLLSFYDQ